MASSSFLTIKSLHSPHDFLSRNPKKLTDHSKNPNAIITRNGPMHLKEEKGISDSRNESPLPPSPFIIPELSFMPLTSLPSKQGKEGSNQNRDSGSETGLLSDQNSDDRVLGSSENSFWGDGNSSALMSFFGQGPRCAWPRPKDSPTEAAPLGPRCAWPRVKSSALANPNLVQQEQEQSIKDGPKCPWPRSSINSHHSDGKTSQPLDQASQLQVQASSIEGPRCPWPRNIITSSISTQTICLQQG